MKKTLSITCSSLLGLALIPMMAFAGGPQYYRAKVVDVIPIQQAVRVSTPHQDCWTAQVVRRDHDRNNAVGMLVGGIAGGVIGNRFGGGNGRKIATVAGTLAGAAVGSELGRRPEGSYTTTQRHCQTVDRWYDEERTVGYRVQYRFRGDTFWTEMEQAPGDTIRVRVEVTPLG